MVWSSVFFKNYLCCKVVRNIQEYNFFFFSKTSKAIIAWYIREYLPDICLSNYQSMYVSIIKVEETFHKHFSVGLHLRLFYLLIKHSFHMDVWFLIPSIKSFSCEISPELFSYSFWSGQDRFNMWRQMQIQS